MKGWPYCIGYIDGSEIKLFEKPPKKHEVYNSRHRKYSVKMQAVCDHKLRIRNVVIGSLGCYHDSKIFKNSIIGKHLKKHFCGNQWIAGESAYPLSLADISAQVSLCDWVMVCCVIYNILLTDHDIPDQHEHLNKF